MLNRQQIFAAIRQQMASRADTEGRFAVMALRTRGLREIAASLGRRTAVLCSSDLVAFGAVTEARALGIAVPERLAICGFGDFDIGRNSEPPITTVSVDGAAMGRTAAENLLSRLAGGTPPRRILVPFRITPRATT